MNNTINPKELRNLPITSFITGILSYIIFAFPSIQMWVSRYFITDIPRLTFNLIFGNTFGIILPVVAILCGSIDLTRIKKGLHRVKLFKGFDITGIVLGSIMFLIVAVFELGEIIFPH